MQLNYIKFKKILNLKQKKPSIAYIPCFHPSSYSAERHQQQLVCQLSFLLPFFHS